ncbi:MAG: T6SS immunity protein Tli4 family protein [Pseudomonadota bacterium]
MGDTTGLTTYCVGRQTIDVPNDARFKGQSNVFWGSTIERIGDATQTSLASLVDEARARIMDIPPPKGLASPFISERRGENGRFWSSVYYPNGIAGGVAAYETLSVNEPHLYRSTGTISASKADLSYEFERKIANAISATELPVPQEEGFCIDGGIIRLPTTYAEEAELVFLLADAIELVIETETVDEPNTETALAMKESGLRGLEVEGFRPKVLREGKRDLNGREGDELIVQVEDAEGLFVWEFPGKPDDGKDPFIAIRATIPLGGDYEAALALWDLILPTLRPRG